MTAAFDRLRQILVRESGISLDNDKGYLADSRLAPLMREHRISTLDHLVARLETAEGRGLLDAVVDAMTTNETFFFRDKIVFDAFRNVILPRLLAERQRTRRIRIWCAAASTGQEPYSLAMILDEEARQLAGWHVELVATDLSRRALRIAAYGLYNQFEVQRGLPITMLLRYFHREGNGWRVNEHLRNRVTLKPFNLLDDPSRLGIFDVILCRNVLIYFDVAKKRQVLGRLAKVLAPDGVLVLGAAETTIGLSRSLQPHPTHNFLNVPSVA